MSRIPEPWFWLGLLVLLFLSFGDAHLRANESVYLIESLLNHDPGLLANDWFVSSNSATPVHFVFSHLFAPLWMISDDPLTVALIGRVLLWLWVIAGVRSLARAFDLPTWAWALGLALYISTSRGLTAGEWIFGGAEQKPACYGAVFFALGALARGRTTAAGLWIGLATSLHVLVGAWSGVAIGVAALVDIRRLRFGRLIIAGIAALVIASPILVVGVRYALKPISTEAALAAPSLPSATELFVRVTVPFHGDPAYFLNPRTIIEIPLIFAAVLWLVFHTAPPAHRRVLVTFVGTICAIFVAGLFARVFEFWDFLMLYPFRLADSVVPVMFWLCIPTTVALAIDVRRRQGGQLDRATTAVLVIALLFFAVEVRHLARNSYQTIVSWLPSTRTATANDLAIYGDIRERLPTDAIIAAAPCESLEWLYGQRALLVAYKGLRANSSVIEWSRRIVAIQGGRPLKTFNNQRCAAESRAFADLPLSQYAALRDDFGVTHALLDYARDDLAEFEVARRHGRSIVALEHIEAGAESETKR